MTDLMKEKLLTQAEAMGKTRDEITQLEIAIEFFRNPEFATKLNDYVFNETYNPKQG